MSSMSSGRTGVPAANLNGKLYVIGEMHHANSTSEVYNPERDVWQEFKAPTDLR